MTLANHVYTKYIDNQMSQSIRELNALPDGKRGDSSANESQWVNLDKLLLDEKTALLF